MAGTNAILRSTVESPHESRFLERAIELALETEAGGNLPIGAVLVLDGEIVAEGANRILVPTPHPGRHAEIVALGALAEHLLPRVGEMTCYTTLEPCVMCFGALLAHGIGRVVYGAAEPLGGATGLLPHLPPAVAAEAARTQWIGPAWPERCDPLFARAAAAYWGA